MAPALGCCFDRSLAPLTKLSAQLNFFGLGRSSAQPPAAAARSPERSAGGGEPRQGAEQRASHPLLDHPWGSGDLCSQLYGPRGGRPALPGSGAGGG